MNDEQYHVTIVGGGISGLAAAFYLQNKAQRSNFPLRFTLIEASPRLGGKILTENQDGFIMEKGPDSFLARKKSATELVTELGMSDQLIRNDTGQAYILHHGRLHPIPKGAVMGIPMQLKPFLDSPLVSLGGKLRTAADLFLPRSDRGVDQSIGQFFRHRLGGEVVEQLIEPLLSGIYAGDIDRLSLRATFPHFYQLEKQYRSLIVATKKTRRSHQSQKKPAKGQFLTLKGGLQSLVDALENHLPTQSILRNTPLCQIEKNEGRYRLYLESGSTVTTDAVILTVPSQAAQKVLDPHPVLQPISQHPATSVANVLLAYPEATVKLEQKGTGFLVPRTADATLTACTWTHIKWPHTTPEGYVLLRCYVGRANDDTIVSHTDDEIVQAVLNDLRHILNINSAPLFHRVTRWVEAMPQYIVGHHTHLKAARNYLQGELPGIFLAGASYEGVGLPDCISQGKKAAESAIKYLSSD